jgi:hypothetical protein
MNQFLNFVLLGFIGPQEIIIILLISLGFGLIPLIFYLITIQNTLKAVSFENRKMQPVEVWLTLIPIFGLVWQFFIVNRVADSLKLEFSAKNITVDEERPGITIGLAYCILFCCSLIPFLGYLTSVAGFVCWIIYWVKINGYRIKMKGLNHE